MKPVVLKPIGAASLMCALASMLFAQQEPNPPVPPAPQQQNQAATTAPPEISKDDPDFGEPVEVYGWLSRGTSKLEPGGVAAVPLNQRLGLPNARPRSPGGMFSFPAGKFNHLEISYFQVDGDGTGVAAVPLGLFGNSIPQGDLLSTAYRVRNAQIVWNYLTWPAPPEDSKWRLRTLYGFNYASVSATIDAPFEPNPNFEASHGTKNIFSPAFGIETEYIPSKNFYVEVRAWGFGVPQHSDIGDAEAKAVARIRHLEIFAGYKLYHYKTGTHTDQYFVGTTQGPTFGLRWLIR